MSVAGAAGVNHVDYAIPAGVTAKIIQASASHDDVAARTLEYKIAHSGGEFLCGGGTSCGAGTPHCLYAPPNPMPEPYLLRYGHTLRVYAWSLAAGKIVTIYIALEIIGGDDTYGD